MPRELILHIGTHKTGTTSLQRFLRMNEGHFERSGIALPTFQGKFNSKNPDRTGMFLTYYFEKMVEAPGVRKQHVRAAKAGVENFKQHARDYDRMLLTDERMSYCGALRPRFWPLMKELFDEVGIDKVSVVVYLRRQDEYAVSQWSQYVKEASKRYTVERYLDRTAMARACDYRMWLERIENVFGEGCVTVRVFDRASFAGGDIYHDFCDALGIPFGDMALPEDDLNISPSGEAIEVKRIANFSPAYRAAGKDANFLMRAISDATLAQDEAARRRGEVIGKTSFLSDERIEEFLGRFAEGNAEVARRYLGREDGVLFAAPKPVERVWERDTDAMIDATIRTFTAALAEQAAEIRRQQKLIDELRKRLAE